MFRPRSHAATTMATALVAVLGAFALMPPAAHAETCAPVEVQNLRVGQGTLMLAAYDSAEAFGSRTPAARVRLPATAETLNFKLCVPGSQTVSITLFQDLNDNGRLDVSVLGIPSEPFGASGTPAAFGPPTWEATQVTLDPAATAPLVIKLSK